ncbi:hypothetical protein IVB36_20355 [Bradyrhizobium sp. 35]|nr:hypothetical protein [Bradyrhizobium sp. 35]
MRLKALDGLVAEELQAVAALDQCDAFSRQALEFDRSNFGAVLLALALLLRLFVVVELAFDAVDGTMEQVDSRPEQIVKIRLEPSVAQGRDQGIEDVGDGYGDDPALGKRPTGLEPEGPKRSGGWRRPAILLRDAKRAGQINNVSSIAHARRKIAGRSHCRPEPLAVRSPSRRPWSRALPALDAS